MPATNKEKWY